MAEARNLAEQAVYGARKALTDNKGKIPAELESSNKRKNVAVESKKGSEDTAVITSALEELSKELSKVYEAIQKAGGTQPPSQEPPPPGTQSAPKDNENK